MSKIDENQVTNIISDNLGIRFAGSKFKLDGWGEVDNWSQLENGVYLFLEVETSQKHPNTNVLKVWPFMDENKKIKIFLIQTFFPNSPGLTSNRGKLCEWTAAKIKNIHGKRFNYYKLVINDSLTQNDFTKLKILITDFLHK